MTNKNIRDPEALRQGLQFQNPQQSLQALVESLADVYGLIRPFHRAESSSVTTQAGPAHTVVETTGTATQTITLSTDHVDTDLVTVIYNGRGQPTIATEGSEKILTADTEKMFARGHSLNLYKQTNWLIESQSRPSGLVDEFGGAIVVENGWIIGL